MAILIALPMVTAQEEITSDLAGITPDSPFYAIDVFWDNVITSFYKGEAKVNLEIRVANERIAEMLKLREEVDELEKFRGIPETSVATERNIELKIRAISKARIEYSRFVVKIKEDSLKTVDAEVFKKVEDSIRKHIVILRELKSNLPVEAQESFQTAIDSSSKVVSRVDKLLCSSDNGCSGLLCPTISSGSTRPTCKVNICKCDLTGVDDLSVLPQEIVTSIQGLRTR